MIRTIWKFTLKSSDGPMRMEMPKGAVVRHVGLDPAGQPCIWAECFVPDDLSSARSFSPARAAATSRAPDMAPREFHIVGTGHPIATDLCFHASFVDGPYVWHLFERII